MNAASEAEADRVEIVYYWALSQFGLGSTKQSLALWTQVPPTKSGATASRWAAKAVALIMGRRKVARDLAIAYYRLVRALRTGSTIHDPRLTEGSTVRMEILRQQFEAAVEKAAPAYRNRPQSASRPTGEGLPQRDSERPSGADSDVVDVDVIEQLEELTSSEDRNARAEAEELMQNLGLGNLIKKLDEIDPDRMTGTELDSARATAHRKVGARQAAAAERISMNAARGLVYDLSEYDGKAMGWVRYSTTGTPCGWCAMLISRGPVYKNAKTAGDMDKYHDNCHCIAVPVFSQTQYVGSDLFRLNREYKRLWPKVTGGLGGDAAITAWRRYFRQQQKKNTSPAPAQEAA